MEEGSVLAIPGSDGRWKMEAKDKREEGSNCDEPFFEGVEMRW